MSAVVIDKLVCRECAWTGEDEEALRAANPFNPEETIVGCPRCLSIDTLQMACDVDGCWKPASNGGPHPRDGKYRSCCAEHGFWTEFAKGSA